MNGMSDDRYILLPEEGTISPGTPAAELLSDLPPVRSMSEPESAPLGAAAEGRPVTVVDTVREDGPRLVESDLETAKAVNQGDVPLRMVPVVEYAVPNPPLRALAGLASETPVATTVTCVDAVSGAGVAGARVVAFTDLARKIGAEGMTDANGAVRLTLPSASIERLNANPPLAGYWGSFLQEVDATQSITVDLTPIDLNEDDCARHYYGGSKFDGERGVEVGVIDSGIGPHRDLNLVSGINTVTGEAAGDYADPGGHGTHVAGLIGSGGAPPAGIRGLAPAVQLRAYRVFPPTGGATNYAILKAMIFAAADGCDVVNLSLGGGPYDPIVAEAIADARNAGMLVVIAAGNGGRAPVSYPAAYDGATAVTAMGRKGTFPAGSIQETKVLYPPLGAERAEFLADFSNVGPQVAVTAPGVGDVSTVPQDAFGVMNGTSMAAPVVAGAVACLLSNDQSIYGMPRGAARSEAIVRLLTDNCRSREFGAIYEGKGMPDPAVV
jgi:subtilisin